MIQTCDFPGHHTFDPGAEIPLVSLGMKVLGMAMLIESLQIGDELHLDTQWKATCLLEGINLLNLGQVFPMAVSIKLNVDCLDLLVLQKSDSLPNRNDMPMHTNLNLVLLPNSGPKFVWFHITC